MSGHDFDRLRSDPARRFLGALHDKPVPTERDDHAARGLRELRKGVHRAVAIDDLLSGKHFRLDAVHDQHVDPIEEFGRRRPRRRRIEDHDGAGRSARLSRPRY